jgi:hypothetical protein
LNLTRRTQQDFALIALILVLIFIRLGEGKIAVATIAGQTLPKFRQSPQRY